MELSTFITSTLNEIFKGVEDAFAHRDVVSGTEDVSAIRGEIGHYSGPVEKNQFISFDISVSSTEAKTKKGGGGIKVVEIFSVGGEASRADTVSQANRIKFDVPITYPRKTKD